MRYYKTPKFNTSWISIFLALPLIYANKLYPQQKPAVDVTSSSNSAVQLSQGDFRFEVASIRATEEASFQYGDRRMKQARPHFDPGLYREEQVRLGILLVEAFEIKHSYELEKPSWMDTEYFTINAVPPNGATKDDVPIMLRHLLEDRFALKYHHETRQMSGYELVMAKPGLGLTQSPAPISQRPRIKGSPIEVGKDGQVHLAKDAGSTELNTGTSAEWRGRNETVTQIVNQLIAKLGVPVIDKSGLDGEYDFTLLYSPDPYRGPQVPRMLTESAPPANSDAKVEGDQASTPTGHSSLLDALREQLGLELKPIKNVSYGVWIIDSARREPTEN